MILPNERSNTRPGPGKLLPRVERELFTGIALVLQSRSGFEKWLPRRREFTAPGIPVVYILAQREIASKRNYFFISYRNAIYSQGE